MNEGRIAMESHWLCRREMQENHFFIPSLQLLAFSGLGNLANGWQWKGLLKNPNTTNAGNLEVFSTSWFYRKRQVPSEACSFINRRVTTWDQVRLPTQATSTHIRSSRVGGKLRIFFFILRTFLTLRYYLFQEEHIHSCNILQMELNISHYHGSQLKAWNFICSILCIVSNIFCF